MNIYVKRDVRIIILQTTVFVASTIPPKFSCYCQDQMQNGAKKTEGECKLYTQLLTATHSHKHGRTWLKRSGVGGDFKEF